MKLNELIEEIKKHAIHHCGEKECYKEGCTQVVDLGLVLGLVKQLDEPRKVKVPQFVAVWYRMNKDNLDKNIAYLCLNNWGEFINDKTLFNWMSNTDNFIQILVNMHQFGYEVEKEKRYLVKVKGMNRINGCLAYNKEFGTWCFGISGNSKNHSTNHTRKELEDADFGWVFNRPGIEIEEVE